MQCRKEVIGYRKVYRNLDEALRYTLINNSGNSGTLAEMLDDSSVDLKIAVVSFSDTATVRTGWTSSKSELYSAVWGMNAMWGNETNVAAGLRKVKENR